MAYDALNRMTANQEPFGLTLTYSYDSVSNRTLVQDSFGGVLTSIYDGANNLTSSQVGGTGQTPARLDLTYTPRNQIATETRYSDLAGHQLVGSTSYSYDAAGRLTNLQHFNVTGGNLANYTYAYDLASRVTSEQDNGTNTSYSYDANSELTAAGATNYSYDLNGNRTMTGYQTGTGNELTSDSTWSYSYDNEGNLTKKTKGASAETWYYGHSNHNQLTSAKQEATDGGTLLMQATYTYDVFGQRLEKDVWTSTTGLTVTRFGYDQGNVWVDLNSTNQLQMRRLYLDGVDQVLARIDSSGNVGWYLTDRLGSVRVLMNSADTTTDVVSYDAFGNITSETNTSFGDRHKWTGRQADSETGLQYNRARYYDVKSGRWTTVDPLGFSAGDSNLYRYLSNDALGGTDPSGLYEPDVHFYMTFYLAQAIGLGDEKPGIDGQFAVPALGLKPGSKPPGVQDSVAYIIAWATQYVDVNSRTNPLKGGQLALTLLHFIVGDGDSVVKPGSPAAKRPVTEAIEQGDPISLGIALHGYQDSWSHQGYTGANGIGHAAADYNGHGPDIPHLHLETALEMAKATYDMLAKYYEQQYGRKPTLTWDQVKQQIQQQLLATPGSKSGPYSRPSAGFLLNPDKGLYEREIQLRCDQWIKAIKDRFNIDVSFTNKGDTDPWAKQFLTRLPPGLQLIRR
jgi:RHS repeat-associated protein